MQPVLLAIATAATFLVGLFVALLMQRGAGRKWAAERVDLERRLAAAERDCARIPEMEGALHQRDTAIGALREELARAQEAIRQERRAAEEKLALLTEARAQMTREFKLLAEEVMRGHSETFGKQNREQIGTILGPLREKLMEFEQGLRTAQTDAAKERAALREHIGQLSERSAAMTTETLNLTRALKGKAQTQGAWGEMVLASILERSGLRAGEEYDLQQSHTGEDGQRLRPDVIVNLPGGQRIVIDSKVSLVAFEAYVNAETDAERSSHLAAHLASLRAHIRGLGGKEYHAAIGSTLDYVILFVPIEGALAAALDADPQLTAFATQCNVAIATPTTLMIALRTVANVWNIERRHRNADDIAARAGALYDKFAGFAEDMDKLGGQLNKARDCYDSAVNKLSRGKGNVVRQLEQLKTLGAATNKTLPTKWVDEDEARELAAE